MDLNTGKRCVQQGKHRNAMSEHGTGTGTRIRTGTGTGTKLEMVILRSVLVIPEFEHGTKFQESRELVSSCDSGASRADEFQGGTSTGGVTGDVTGSELAEVYQQSHMSVTGRNMVTGSVTSANGMCSTACGHPKADGRSCATTACCRKWCAPLLGLRCPTVNGRSSQ